VRATGYSELVDLLLGLDGVLYATDAAAEDEDPVIDPDGCAWIAGGLERFVSGHAQLGDEITFEVGGVRDPSFLAVYRREGQPVAVLGVDQPKLFTRWRRQLAVVPVPA